MSEDAYLREAYEHYQQSWDSAMRREASRRLVIKASTLAALGGASVIQALLEACAPLAQQAAPPLTSYRWSKYPAIERYNFRNLPWPSTPFVDGVHIRSGGGVANWNVFRAALQSWGSVFDALRKPQAGNGADMVAEKLENNLASLTPARDFSYFDYTIRPNARFHNVPPVNGRRFTAEDARYSLERYQKDSVSSAPLRVIDHFEVRDEATLRVHLARPILWLDHLVASNDYWMVAREHAEGPLDYFQSQPIGTGPFRVTKYTIGVGVESERHEYGRQDGRWPAYSLPFLKEVRSVVINDTAALDAAYRSRQIDFRNTQIAVEGLNALLETNPESIVQVSAPSPNSTSGIWGFNLTEPPLNDVRVRRALNMAINRRQMIDLLWGGMASVTYPMTYHHMGYADPLDADELGPWYRYSPDEARALLSEAGYPDGFELEYMSGSPVTNTDTVAIEHLKEIGVRVKIVTVESTVLTANRASRKFKHAINGGRLGVTSWTPIKMLYDFWAPESTRNVSGVNDPALNDLIERAAYTLDADEQVRLVRQINQRVLDQAYYLETVVGFWSLVRHPWLHNVASSVQGNFCCYGNTQMDLAWVDDTAPSGRAGRLKA